MRVAECAYLLVHVPNVFVFDGENHKTFWILTQQWFEFGIEFHCGRWFDSRKAFAIRCGVFLFDALVHIQFTHFIRWCTINDWSSDRFDGTLSKWRWLKNRKRGNTRRKRWISLNAIEYHQYKWDYGIDQTIKPKKYHQCNNVVIEEKTSIYGLNSGLRELIKLLILIAIVETRN